MTHSFHEGLKLLYAHYSDYNFYNSILLFMFSIMLSASITKFSLKKLRSKSTSKGIVNTFVQEQELIMRIHHAANNCWRGRKYIDDCKDLINIDRSLINKPIPPFGYTPFLRVCTYGCVELLAYMLDNGADPTICTKFGEGPVYLATYAVVKGRVHNIDALDLLVNSGCCINLPKDKYYTPIHLAARFGHDNLLCWLLMNGANPETPKCRYSPYEYALKYGNKSGADLLCVTDDVE